MSPRPYAAPAPPAPPRDRRDDPRRAARRAAPVPVAGPAPGPGDRRHMLRRRWLTAIIIVLLIASGRVSGHLRRAEPRQRARQGVGGLGDRPPERLAVQDAAPHLRRTGPVVRHRRQVLRDQQLAGQQAVRAVQDHRGRSRRVPQGLRDQYGDAAPRGWCRSARPTPARSAGRSLRPTTGRAPGTPEGPAAHAGDHGGRERPGQPGRVRGLDGHALTGGGRTAPPDRSVRVRSLVWSE